jgi:hypothetical protein
MATIFSGGTYINNTFVASTKADLVLNMRDQLVLAGWTSVPLAAGQGPGNVGAVTITIANPGVVTFNNHGFLGGEKVVLQTTGVLPGNLGINYVYYVKYIDANNFNLASSLNGANIATTGSQSGVHTLNTQYVLLQSATQPTVTNPIRVKIQDNLAATPHVGVSVQNQAGTVVGSNNGGGTQVPTLLTGPGKTWRIIATKYQFFCFTPAPSAAKEFVMAGMVCVPSFLTGINDHGYVAGSGYSEADSSVRASMRGNTSTSNNYVGTGNGTNGQLIWNASYYESAYCLNNPGGMAYIFMRASNYDSDGLGSNYRWANDQLLTSDVLLTCGLLTANAPEEAKIKGQLFDIVYVSDAFAGDATDTFNGHPWFNLTNNNTASNQKFSRGGFWVATS